MGTRANVAILAASMVAAACGRIQLGGADKQQQMDQALQQIVAARAPAYVGHDPEGSRIWKQTRAFYESRSFTAAWIEKAKPRPQLAELIAALREAEHEGLDPELYTV